MSKGARWPGEWLGICDVCGFTFASGDMRERWDGLMVCRKDYEPRHPQDLLRLNAETVVPPWTRPEAPDVFIPVCNLWETYSFSGLAGAGCARSGKVGPLSLQFLKELKLSQKGNL